MTYKVKVCDRFNTIEWETENPTTEECQKIYDILSTMNIVEKESQTIKKTTEKTVSGKPKKPATEPQKKLLRQKGIPYNDERTSQEAYFLLQKFSNVFPDQYVQ